jgi:hypothetical protein
MSPATRALHEGLIRALKGMLAAWESWLKAQPTRP